MTNITVEISFPYGAVFKYSGPTEQLSQVKELFSKWIGRASSVCFSNSKRTASSTQQVNPGSSKKKRKRRPRKGKLQGGKKPGLPAHKQPQVKQPPPAKACKCTVCSEDFTSHSARKKHFNISHKPVNMEVETNTSFNKKKRKASHLITSDTSSSTSRKIAIISTNIDKLDVDTVTDMIKQEGGQSGNYLIFHRRSE